MNRDIVGTIVSRRVQLGLSQRRLADLSQAAQNAAAQIFKAQHQSIILVGLIKISCSRARLAVSTFWQQERIWFLATKGF